MAGYEGDIVEVTKAGYLYEFKVKVSRSDFFADVAKRDRYYRDNPTKHQLIERGDRVNYFTYVVPKGLVSANEVPSYAGLIWVHGIHVANVTDLSRDWGELRISTSVIKRAPKLSSVKHGVTWLPKLLQSTYMKFHAGQRQAVAKLLSNS